MGTSVIGQPVTRIDGKLKVTGGARYAADYPIENLAYGVGVPSTIASGRILKIDVSNAEAMHGVLAILRHDNFPKLYRPANAFEPSSRAGESRPPLDDDNIYYYGQFVALVIADSFEQAQAAAVAVHVDYDAKKPAVFLRRGTPSETPAAQHHRGDAESAFKQAPVQLGETYTTPVETHNPMEMHATIAVWHGDKVTLFESSQGVVNHLHVMSEMLGIPLENIQVISRFIGSGFGGKLFPWPHSLLAAIGSRHVGRPVKLSVPRTLMFTTVGHRPAIRQKMRIGATADGKMVSMQNDILQHTSMVDDFVENCVEATSMLYSCPNVTAVQRLVRLNVGTPTPMRGPGRTPALFAIESAMDEMALKLNMDPLEFRLRNYAETDEGSQRPFSSKHLREAYQTGAEKFGWSRRNPKVGSMREGDLILGWGMATCTWPASRHAAEVRVRLLADGTARASCATQDIGTGTYTVFAEVVSDKTGISVDKVQVVLGDSSLPPGPTSGGSSVTSTVLPAIAEATENAVTAVLKAATQSANSPFHGADPSTLKMTQARVHLQDKSPESGVPFQEILAMQQFAGLDGQAKTDADPASRKFSTHSFGAHFCEISVDPGIARLRVRRWLTVMDGGRMINEKTARNQILGGVVMGIGMGLFEATVYDPRDGHPINNNFADYIVAVNADIPEMDCIFLDYPDMVLNEYGARGVGEIGLTGVASALAAATYHATGVRVRDLPIRIENLLV
ncbi:MAG: xanthine dehydrogenase family protein molybdopterin-binding subunit [Candidatus Acidiferrales bacterium]